MALHPEAQALMDRFEELGARTLDALGVTGARLAIHEARALSGEREVVASVKDILIPGEHGFLPGRVYHPDPTRQLPLMVYFHGGGWIAGSIATVDRLCRSLAIATSSVVTSVEYRRSPETQFPGPLDDAVRSTQWLAEQRTTLGAEPQRLIVAGDSAGGGLAAGTALRLKDEHEPTISDLILLYPALSAEHEGNGIDPDGGRGHGLTHKEMAFFWRNYLPAHERHSPYASPLLHDNLTGLPRTLLITAEYDVLRAEALHYTERLAAAGVDVTEVTARGMVHGFFGQFGAVPTARQYLHSIDTFLKAR